MKLNLPNKLTLARMALVPLFMVFADISHYGRADHRPVFSLIAALVFTAASLTDYLDGNLARKHNLVTNFGKFADPLADKMLTTAALLYMVVDGACSPVVLAVVLFREFAVAGVRMLAASKNKVIAANIWGKVKTVLQMATIIVYYFAGFFAPADAIGVVTIGTQALCWAVAAATLLSGFIYIKDNAQVLLD